MDSKTYVTLDMQAPNIAVVAAGKQNDLMSRQIVCQLQDGSVPFTPPVDAAAMIRYAKPDNTAGFYDVLEDGTTPAWSVSGSTITITLCEQMLTVAGRVWVEINLYTSTAKLTTFYFLLEVQRSVLEDATIISSDYYNVLSAQIQALLGATTNPPQIDPITKNWLLWDEDTGAYVDSGFSSVGTTGPQGPQGVSIASTSKASGSGAPGTTDVYNVNLSNGTVAGQFNVYNGNDGQGSPGSATPLSDSGSGVVGTASAYSRQDHRHPLNVDSTNPAPLGTAAPGSAGTYARRDHVHPVPSASDVGALPSATTAADIGGMSKWALLWTNASITSDFAAQTIQIDLTGYDIVAVEAVYAGSAADNSAFFFGVVGGAGFYITSIGPLTGTSAYVAERSCTFVTGGIAISDAVRRAMASATAGSTSTGNAIPYRVYGIKGVTT